MIMETKIRRSTSYAAMRLLLTLAVVLLGLPGISSAFTCPRMTPAEVHNESCSHCPNEEPEESCPVSECLLICPYTVEKTAVLNAEGLADAFTLSVQPYALLVPPPVPIAANHIAHLTGDFDAGQLYLINRVLLI
jgi:hypothetical protein